MHVLQSKSGFTLIEVVLALGVGAALVSMALMIYVSFAKPSVEQLKQTIGFYDLMMMCQEYSSFSTKGCFPEDTQKLSDFTGDPEYLAAAHLTYTCSPSSIQLVKTGLQAKVAKKSAPILGGLLENALRWSTTAKCEASGSTLTCTITPNKGSFCCE